jgi:tRNA nucleotidyltransferase/poly(A) polymerase
VKRLGISALALFLLPCSPLHAQNAAIDELKGKIFDARTAQQTLGNGLKYCSELNGKSFYYQLRNRILNLEEYFHSLENLVKAQVFNPDKRRPWTLQDAKERWEEVKKQAQADKEKCELVQSLPELEKRLAELQKASAASDKKE